MFQKKVNSDHHLGFDTGEGTKTMDLLWINRYPSLLSQYDRGHMQDQERELCSEVSLAAFLGSAADVSFAVSVEGASEGLFGDEVSPVFPA